MYVLLMYDHGTTLSSVVIFILFFSLESVQLTSHIISPTFRYRCMNFVFTLQVNVDEPSHSRLPGNFIIFI